MARSTRVDSRDRNPNHDQHQHRHSHDHHDRRHKNQRERHHEKAKSANLNSARNSHETPNTVNGSDEKCENESDSDSIAPRAVKTADEMRDGDAKETPLALDPNDVFCTGDDAVPTWLLPRNTGHDDRYERPPPQGTNRREHRHQNPQKQEHRHKHRQQQHPQEQERQHQKEHHHGRGIRHRRQHLQYDRYYRQYETPSSKGQKIPRLMRTTTPSDSLFHAVHLGLVQIMHEPYTSAELREAVASTAADSASPEGKGARDAWRDRLKYALEQKDTVAIKELEFAWPLLMSRDSASYGIKGSFESELLTSSSSSSSLLSTSPSASSLDLLYANMCDPSKYAGDEFAVSELERRLKVRLWMVDSPEALSRNNSGRSRESSKTKNPRVSVIPRVRVDQGTIDTLEATVERIVSSHHQTPIPPKWRGLAWNIVLVHDEARWKTLSIKDADSDAYFVAFKTLDIPMFVLNAAAVSCNHKSDDAAIIRAIIRASRADDLETVARELQHANEKHREQSRSKEGLGRRSREKERKMVQRRDFYRNRGSEHEKNGSHDRNDTNNDDDDEGYDNNNDDNHYKYGHGHDHGHGHGYEYSHSGRYNDNNNKDGNQHYDNEYDYHDREYDYDSNHDFVRARDRDQDRSDFENYSRARPNRGDVRERYWTNKRDARWSSYDEFNHDRGSDSNNNYDGKIHGGYDDGGYYSDDFNDRDSSQNYGTKPSAVDRNNDRYVDGVDKSDYNDDGGDGDDGDDGGYGYGYGFDYDSGHEDGGVPVSDAAYSRKHQQRKHYRRANDRANDCGYQNHLYSFPSPTASRGNARDGKRGQNHDHGHFQQSNDHHQLHHHHRHLHHDSEESGNEIEHLRSQNAYPPSYDVPIYYSSTRPVGL